MATANTRKLARAMLAPSVVLLFIWMIVPLLATLWFSFQGYNLLNTNNNGFNNFVGFSNYAYFLSDPSFFEAFRNTLILTVSVLAITVVGGIVLALLLDRDIVGQGIVRILIISPFFIMPTVAALVWKNMLMDPNYGIFAWIATRLGFAPIAWLENYPLLSVILIVAWQWLPFATLILLTAIQSLDEEQKEAAGMDGANFINLFIYIVLPHLARAITVVILIETIFLLSVFAEIYVTTGGGPGYASTNIAYLVYHAALLDYDVGGAAAGGVVAVILANIVAFFLVRIVGKNLSA
jgi:sorbitol/mannitol transport system permease protein